MCPVRASYMQLACHVLMHELVTVAVGYRVGSLGPQWPVQPSVGALAAPGEWVAELTQGLQEVMNAESLEMQAVFRSDHMARHPLHACALGTCLHQLSRQSLHGARCLLSTDRGGQQHVQGHVMIERHTSQAS